MLQFRGQLKIIVGNPYVDLPPTILEEIFLQSHRYKGPIPVRGTINGNPYQQTFASSVWESKSTYSFRQLVPIKAKRDPSIIANLKSDESINRNIARAIDFLLGNGNFVGRDKP